VIEKNHINSIKIRILFEEEIPMDLYQAIKERRSIRRYKEDSIEEAVVLRLIEAAQWAPSWAHTQCVSLVAVDDADVKAALTETLAEGNPATKAMGQAPLVFAFCAQKGRAGYKKGEASTPKGDNWLMFDVGLSMQNFMLSAHAEGLATVCIGLFDSEKAAKVLGLPENMEVVALTPLGYPAQEANIPPRKAVDIFCHKNKYSA
jgi:nitroreductase